MTPLVRVPTRLSRSWRADAGRSAMDWLLVARLHADCGRHSVEFRAAVVLPVHDGQSTAACTVVVAQRDSRRQPAHVHLYQVVEARQRLADVLVCVCVCVCVSQFWRPFSRWTWVSPYQNVSILDFRSLNCKFDFSGAKDDASGGNNWSYKTCKVPVKMSPSTNQHPVCLCIQNANSLRENRRRSCMLSKLSKLNVLCS